MDNEVHHNISIIGDQYVLDGNPLSIVSGSLHYFRVPSVYWKDRLHKLKAAGLNSVATYVEWSYHEPEERQYKFEGDQDIAKFIRTAAEEGLHVLLRVGPYICAERDLGGLPYWLLGKYPNIKLRTNDKDFIAESKIWVAKLFEQVSPLLFGNGGPIILVQVENEYGSYDSDMAYKVQMRDILLAHVGNRAILYTTDGATIVRAGMIPGVHATIDFGVTKEPIREFNTLRRYRPSPGPLMNSEFYPGWLTHWGEQFAQTNAQDVVTTLRKMLDSKINVNFYVFFGGTNFEYTAGANFDGTYQPDITSYDYDAPLSEAGDPTTKYYAIRDALKQYNFVDEKIDPPVPSQKGAYGTVTVTPKLSLLSTVGRSRLGKKYDDVKGAILPTYEYLRQRGGLMLYETSLTEKEGMLVINKPRDLVYVFVDGVLQGTISRMRKVYNARITAQPGSILSLFVENQGRINYGDLHDRKGILSEVTFNDNVLNGTWTVTGFPLEIVNTANLEKPCIVQGPTFYNGVFVLPDGKDPLDTFLDTTGWGKGYIWLNGHNLGRYWPGVGPQVTLYVPGAWLHSAPQNNELQILELETPSADLTVKFIDHPILNRTGNINSWKLEKRET